jgi:hypothetical protein
MCRDNYVLTPEDEYAVWPGLGGPVIIVPLFPLYDHSWLAPGATTKEESWECARRAGVVCADEVMLHSDPYPDRESWCEARVQESERRLLALGSKVKTVLVSHWPLVRQVTDALRFPEFARWCGTTRTANWHTRFNAEVVVYGHLHIPRTSHYATLEPRANRRRSDSCTRASHQDSRNHEGGILGVRAPGRCGLC